MIKKNIILVEFEKDLAIFKKNYYQKKFKINE